MLTVRRTSLIASGPEPAVTLSNYELALIVVELLAIAVGATLGFLLICWQTKGIAALTEPGQWLAILLLYVALEPWLIRLLVASFGPWPFRPKDVVLWNSSDWFGFIGLLLQGVLMWSLSAVVYVVAAVRTADTRVWRLFLIFSAIGLAFQMISYVIWSTWFLMGFGVGAYMNFMQNNLTPRLHGGSTIMVHLSSVHRYWPGQSLMIEFTTASAIGPIGPGHFSRSQHGLQRSQEPY